MAGDSELTENEGSLLSLVIRYQPISPYQLHMFYDQSPVSSFNTSKGAVYPIIKRLKQRGLIEGAPVGRNNRGTEALTATPAGVEALKQWVKALRPEFVLLADPMRTRVLSLECLSREEMLEWVIEARRMVADKKAEVIAYDKKVTVPFQQIVKSATLGYLESKADWLDQLISLAVKKTDD